MQHYPDREGRCLEFKEKVNNYQSVVKTVVAFSNDIGGKIYIGIRDNDRAIVGVTEEDLERYLEDLPKAIFDSVSPSCRPLIAPRRLGDQKVLEIQVYPGSNKPYYITSKGVEKGVCIRVGAHTKIASREVIEELSRERERRAYDEELISQLAVEVLDTLSLRTFYQTPNVSTERLLADKVIGLSPITRELSPTIAGVLFFHPEPRTVLPQAEILFSHLEGTDLSSVRRTLDLSLPIPLLVSEVLATLRPVLSLGEQRKNARLSPYRLEIPELAIRESLLNALIHRKYTIPDAVKVALFADRLEIFSPGNFPGPITDLRSGISYTRNPTIRQLARKAGLVEKRGWGFSLIFSECKKNGNPEPQITEGPDYVKVTLWREHSLSEEVTSKRSIQPSLPSHLKPFQSLQQRQQSFQTLEVMQLFHCSENTARSRIKELLFLDLIQAEGKGRARRYYWK